MKSKIRCGVYSKQTNYAAAFIRGWRLFEGGVYSKKFGITRHLSCQWRSSITSSLLTGPLHACQTHQLSPDPSAQRSLSSVATATPLFFALTYTVSDSLLRLPVSIAVTRTIMSTTSFCFALLLTLNVFDFLVLFQLCLYFGRILWPSGVFSWPVVGSPSPAAPRSSNSHGGRKK